MPSKLLTNGTILSFNPENSSIVVIRNSHLLITGDTISAISSDLSSVTAPPDTEVIDCSCKIISPGFVDTHRHLWQTAYRTQAPNVTLTEYFLRFGPQGLSTGKNAYTADDIYISTLAGYCEALNSGVTTLLDHAHNHWRKDVMQAGLHATNDSGARVWWCFDPTGHVSEGWSYNDQVEELKKMVEKLRAIPSGTLVKFGLAFDSIDQADQNRLDRIKTLIHDLNLEAMTTHYLGGPWPIGGNSPSAADSRGLLDLPIPVIFSHGGYIPSADRDLLRSKNHFLSITPESEMHYGHGRVTSRQVQDHASLGIDTAFTFSGDILTQARIWLQTVRLENYNKTLADDKIPRESPMTAEQAFLLATRQGGKALRRDDIGVLRVGAKADILVFDGDSPNMCGWSDPVAAVVLHANVGDIEGVIVGGEWRKKGGELVGTFGGMRWEELRQRFKETARSVQEANRDGVTLPESLFGAEFGDVEKVRL